MDEEMQKRNGALAAGVRQPLCPLCGAERTRHAFSKSGYDIYRCDACDFRFVFPPPADTASLYGEDYFHGACRGFGYVNYDEDKVAMQPFFRSVLEVIERFCPERGNLLDVGAASGFFAKMAQERGWSARGLEISSHAAAEARRGGVDVRVGTLTDGTFPGGSFDAITFLDVLEHIARPNGTVRACRELLRTGGVLFINTPDTASVWAKVFGKRWLAFLPPEHLSLFNRENLGLLLERNSFRVVASGKLRKRFTLAYVCSILYRWQKVRVWQWLSRLIAASALGGLPLPINIRDNFFIIARAERGGANKEPRG